MLFRVNVRKGHNKETKSGNKLSFYKQCIYNNYTWITIVQSIPQIIISLKRLMKNRILWVMSSMLPYWEGKRAPTLDDEEV